MPLDLPPDRLVARIRSPFGARTSFVAILVAVLALVAGGALVGQISDQMRRDADARLDARTDATTADIAAITSQAAADLRLARRNEVFDRALLDTPGQLLAAGRVGVEAAISYLG